MVNVNKMSGPNFITRFNLYLAEEMMGAPAPGYRCTKVIGLILISISYVFVQKFSDKKRKTDPEAADS